MKKKMISLFITVMILMTGVCHAASYTLPEKLLNQLSIGSGLKGNFTIHAEGDEFRTPFLEAVSDAGFFIRGMSSGSDLHYYVFQGDEAEQRSAVSELYRKDGVYYFRSDMVPEKILAFPVLSQYLETMFPAEGENGSASSFVSNILRLTEQEKKEKWDPVLTRYQNKLEFWLADFAFNPVTVKLDNGFFALDFTYEIPAEKVKEKIVSIVGEIASDKEASALFDSVMTPEEKNLYLNSNLLYFYQEALDAVIIDKPVRMSKRVSAVGDLLRFKLELPLDEKTTGYQSLDIDMLNNLTIYTLRKSGQVYILGTPDMSIFSKPEYEQSVWFSSIRLDDKEETKKENISVRADIKKTHEEQQEEEKTHETEHYSISVVQDLTYLPEEIDQSLVPEFETVKMDINMHYSSKYAQNSATELVISSEINRGSSKMTVSADVKSAAPWLFVPFEVKNPEAVMPGSDRLIDIDSYMSDWISNAKTMLRYNDDEETENGNKNGKDTQAENSMAGDAETEPLDE